MLESPAGITCTTSAYLWHLHHQPVEGEGPPQTLKKSPCTNCDVYITSLLRGRGHLRLSRNEDTYSRLHCEWLGSLWLESDSWVREQLDSWVAHI